MNYYCKCGMAFGKSGEAKTTGYKLEYFEEDGKCYPTNTTCRVCPWWKEVTRWTKDGYVVDYLACRAGSEPPNHTTEWSAPKDLYTHNHLKIRSLDHKFMEAVIAYCKDDPDLSGAYLHEDEPDCRKIISIGCSQNRKGINAKQAMIAKFFPEDGHTPDAAELGLSMPEPIPEPEETALMASHDPVPEILEEYAQKIRNTAASAIYVIGQNLAEANSLLANFNRSGQWGAWVESVGFSRSSAQNYIAAYRFLSVQNLHNTEIPQSLLFEVARPSAPPELVEDVLAGRITTHKEYKAALKEQTPAVEKEPEEAKPMFDPDPRLKSMSEIFWAVQALSSVQHEQLEDFALKCPEAHRNNFYRHFLKDAKGNLMRLTVLCSEKWGVI